MKKDYHHFSNTKFHSFSEVFQTKWLHSKFVSHLCSTECENSCNSYVPDIVTDVQLSHIFPHSSTHSVTQYSNFDPCI